MDKLLFHIAAFEINKLCSLRPEIIDWGLYEKYATVAFEKLWR